MKNKNSRPVLAFIVFFFGISVSNCSVDHPALHATLYALMGKPTVKDDGSRGFFCQGAGICSSSMTTFGVQEEIILDCSYDPDAINQITLSFLANDMYSRRQDHYANYFSLVGQTNQTTITYSFGKDCVLDESLCSQLGITPPARIPANTPSLSLTNDGTTVTLVMPLVHN